MLKLAFRNIKLLAAAFAISLLLPLTAFAYTTDSYNVNVKVNENNSYQVEENIHVDFNESKHGIYRYIPLNGPRGTTAIEIEDVKVDKWMYDHYEEGDFYMVQIGDPDIFVKGPQSYKIQYTMSIYDDKNTSSDMLYIDVLPTDWETAIESTAINITMPKDIDSSKLQITASCYGDNTVHENVNYSYDKGSRTIHISGHDLPLGTGITVYCPLPEGYWQNQMNNDWAYPISMLLIFLTAALIAVLWLGLGRDRKFVETVEFRPPDGITPAEAGYLLDNSVDEKDMISMVVYYADKGYLSINEYEEKKFSLTKLKDIDIDEPSFSVNLFNAFFKKGNTVKLDDLDEDFALSFEAAQELLKEKYSGENSVFEPGSSIGFIFSYLLFAGANVLYTKLLSLYSPNSFNSLLGFLPAVALMIAVPLLYIYVNSKYTSSGKGLLFAGSVFATLGIGAATFITYTATSSLMSSLLYIATAIVAVVSMAFMAQRTEANAKFIGRLTGFRNFIEKAELDRIKMLAEENPSYFFSILPYAYVFGLTDTWIEKFENIPLDTPGWYTYDTGTYNPLHGYWIFSSMTRNMSNNLSENIQVPMDADDVGGGGFLGGGGFTGGGFGGGGGGSW